MAHLTGSSLSLALLQMAPSLLCTAGASCAGSSQHHSRHACHIRYETSWHSTLRRTSLLCVLLRLLRCGIASCVWTVAPWASFIRCDPYNAEHGGVGQCELQPQWCIGGACPGPTHHLAFGNRGRACGCGGRVLLSVCFGTGRCARSVVCHPGPVHFACCVGDGLLLSLCEHPFHDQPAMLSPEQVAQFGGERFLTKSCLTECFLTKSCVAAKSWL
jgi:hypothetical protein